MEIKLPTYHPSKTAIKFHNCGAFVRGVVAGVGTGKSVMMIQELLQIGFNQAKGKDGVRRSRFGLIRATYPSLRTTTIKTFSQWLPPSIAPVKQTAPMESTFSGGLPDGSTFHMEFVFLAVEKLTDTQKLKSMEFTAIFINEAREVDFEVFETCKERVGRYPPIDPDTGEGGSKFSGVIFDSNPPSVDHWIAQLDFSQSKDAVIFHQPSPFIERTLPDGVIEYLDNPEAENLEYLNQKPPPPDGRWTLEERRAMGYEYYRRQLPGKPQSLIDSEIMGKYATNFHGKPVYGEYWVEDCVSSESLQFTTHEALVLGIDTTGLNPAVVIGQASMGTLRVLGELLVLDCAFSPFVETVLIPYLVANFPKCNITAIVDPANPRGGDTGKTPIEILRNNGIEAMVASTNALKPRLESVKARLQKRGGLLIDQRCKTLLEGFRGGYHYRPLRVSGIQKAYSPEPEKNEYSHIHDAMQYLCLGLAVNQSQRRRKFKRIPDKRVY